MLAAVLRGGKRTRWMRIPHSAATWHSGVFSKSGNNEVLREQIRLQEMRVKRRASSPLTSKAAFKSWWYICKAKLGWLTHRLREEMAFKQSFMLKTSTQSHQRTIIFSFWQLISVPSGTPLIYCSVPCSSRVWPTRWSYWAGSLVQHNSPSQYVTYSLPLPLLINTSTGSECGTIAEVYICNRNKSK